MPQSKSSSGSSGGGQTSSMSTGGGRTGGTTGTRDITFNLVSILYHALEGAETYGKYIQDAEQEGDKDLIRFFEEVKNEELKRSERCKEHLSKYLEKGRGSQRRAA